MLLGREAEVDRLRELRESAARGSGRALVLTGEAGMGKTTLAEHAAHEAAGAGFSVRWGRCWEHGGAPALWPWSQALRGLARDGALSVDQGARHIARLVPALAPDGAPAATEQDRFALFAEVAETLAETGRRRPLLLVLEDVHAADTTSLLLLRFLARETRTARVLVLATARDDGGPAADLAGDVERLELGPLAPQALATLLDTPPGTPLERLIDLTGGNPFIAREIHHLLDGGDRLTGPLPQSVRDVLEARLASVGAATREVLEAAAVVGRWFAPALLARLPSVAGDVAPLLAPAVDAGLVERAGDGRLRFAHALLREALYADLDDLRRRTLHREAASAIREARSGDPDAVAEIAHHLLEGLEPGMEREAVQMAREAAARAEQVLAHEDAARLYERAATVLDAAGAPPQETAPLLVDLGRARWRTADSAGARSAFLSAGAAAHRAGDHETLAAAALGMGGRFGWLDASGVVDREQVDLLETALRAQPEGDRSTTAELTARLSTQLYFDDTEDHHREALSRRAVAMARRTGDAAALAYCLNAHRFALATPRLAGERRAAVDELIAAAELADEPELLMRGYSWRLSDALEEGHLAEAARAADAGAALARRLRQPLYLAAPLKWRSTQALISGRFAEAEELVQAFGEFAGRFEDPDLFQATSVHLFILRAFQGRMHELLGPLRAMAEQFEEIVAWRAAVAFGHLAAGRAAEAEEEFERLAAGGFAFERQLGSYGNGLMMSAEVCAEVGDAPRAGELYERLSVYEGRCVVVPYAAAFFGPADRSLGLLAATAGRHDAAERHFEHALALCRRMGARPWLAWTQRDYALMLARRGGDDARERAKDLLSAAARTAADTGAELVSERVAAAAHEVDLETPVTLLFSDIVGSTAALQRLGDREWLQILRRHDACIRQEVAAAGGHVVKSRGDGFMVAFAGARRALACAAAIQRAIAARDDIPVEVRIGLHTGAALRDGDDYFGTAVNVAARISDKAGAGEVLASAATRAAAGAGFAFDVVATVELKGLDGRHALLRLRP